MIARVRLALVVVLVVSAFIAALQSAGQGSKQKTIPKTQQGRTSDLAGDRSVVIIQHETPAAQTQAQANNPKPKPPNWWERLLADPVAVFTGLILFVYVGLFCIGLKQIRISREQFDRAKRDSEESLRIASDAVAAAKTGADAASKQVSIMDAQTPALRESADAAKESADVARDELAAMDRAWMKEGTEMVTFEFRDNGDLFLFFKMRMENVGRSVANGVQLRTGTIFIRPREDTRQAIREAQDGLIDNPHEGSGVALTLFPNDPVDAPISNFYNRQSYETGIHENIDGGRRTQRLKPIFVGVVLYKYPTSEDLHKTRFAYTIRWKDNAPVGALPPIPSFPEDPIVGQNIIPRDFEFSRFLYGGNEAD